MAEGLIGSTNEEDWAKVIMEDKVPNAAIVVIKPMHPSVLMKFLDGMLKLSSPPCPLG